MSATRTLVVSDLDRTLVYSAAALQLTVPDEECPALASVEVLEGRPHSFLTLVALQQLQQVATSASFVPVTTRTVRQYRRIGLPGIRPRFAVVSNGGQLLIDGRPDPLWAADVRADLASGFPLADVVAELDRRTQGGWARNRRVADDLFCYLVAEPADVPAHFLADWRTWCAERDWTVSVQGRKIYAIPSALTKERALAEVARRIDAQRIVAAGDGSLDAGFLNMADAGIRPAHGELAAQGWTAAHLRITDQVGVLAGEEIVGFFAAQLGHVGSAPQYAHGCDGRDLGRQRLPPVAAALP